MIGALVDNLDLGAQAVEAEALDEVGRERRRAVDEERQAGVDGRLHHQEVEQDLALRRQQRGVARLAGAEALDVIGQEPLQKAVGVGARDPDHPAVGEISGPLSHRSPPRLANPAEPS